MQVVITYLALLLLLLFYHSTSWTMRLCKKPTFPAGGNDGLCCCISYTQDCVRRRLSFLVYVLLLVYVFPLIYL